MILGENIKALRKEKNLRQEQLAEAMGVSAASVSKWETGQCAPELTVLMELADYFEISIDTLLGHNVRSSRIEDLIQEMNKAANERDENQAAALCEKLLRNYPNNEKIVQTCANCYYKLFVYFGNENYMHRCIAQTQRLMVLKQGEPERDRLERIHDLGNQYSLLEQWDTAKEYYEQSNVCNCNKAAIAQCLLKQERFREAIEMLSDDLTNSVFHIYQSVNGLAEGWRKTGEYAKSCAALTWVYEIMDAVHYNSTIMMLIQIELAASYQSSDRHEQALAAIRKAAQLAANSDAGAAMADFLQAEKEPEFLISSADDHKLLSEVAEKMGAAFADAVREVLA